LYEKVNFMRRRVRYCRLRSLDSAAGWLWAAAKRLCLGIGARIL